jgi:imidazole glycerol-phosphate synthase subunit HisH
METIAVIDYGMGNLRSVAKALEHVANGYARVRVTASADDIANADRIVFPGQGAAGDCMRELQQRQLIEPLRQAAAEKPFLGICMGMQVLADASDEDQGVECLGIVKGQVRALRTAHAALAGEVRYKLPHMGWNQVHQSQAHALWDGIPQDVRFYFVHSYYFSPADTDCTVGTTRYGADFTCAIAHRNLFALQCHPEKSANAGLALLRNFVHWNGHE